MEQIERGHQPGKTEKKREKLSSDRELYVRVPLVSLDNQSAEAGLLVDVVGVESEELAD